MAASVVGSSCELSTVRSSEPPRCDGSVPCPVPSTLDSSVVAFKAHGHEGASPPHSSTLTGTNCELKDTVPSRQSTAASSQLSLSPPAPATQLPRGRTVPRRVPACMQACSSPPAPYTHLHANFHLPAAAKPRGSVYRTQGGRYADIENSLPEFSVTTNPLHSPRSNPTSQLGRSEGPLASDAYVGCLVDNPLFHLDSQLTTTSTSGASEEFWELFWDVFMQSQERGDVVRAVRSAPTLRAPEAAQHLSRRSNHRRVDRTPAPATPRHRRTSFGTAALHASTDDSVAVAAEEGSPRPAEAASAGHATRETAAHVPVSEDVQVLTASTAQSRSVTWPSTGPLPPKDLNVYGTCGDSSMLSTCRSSTVIRSLTAHSDDSQLLMHGDKVSSQSTVGVRRMRHIWVVKPRGGPGRVTRTVLQSYLRQMVKGPGWPWERPLQSSIEVPPSCNEDQCAHSGDMHVPHASAYTGTSAPANLRVDGSSMLESSSAHDDDTMQVLLQRQGSEASEGAARGWSEGSCVAAVKRMTCCFTCRSVPVAQSL